MHMFAPIVPADMIYSPVQAGRRAFAVKLQRAAVPIRHGYSSSVPLLAGTRHLHHTLTMAGIVLETQGVMATHSFY